MLSTYDTGMATAAEIGEAMSRRAVRRSARTTRPGLKRPHRAAPSEVGITLGRQAGLHHRRLYASLEEVVLAVAPPRTGKTAWLGNVVIDSPGACVATSTRADLHEHTAALRSRTGPVLVFNPEGLGGVASTLRWSPLDGCVRPQTAMLRAGYLLSGSPGAAGTEDRHFWEGNSFKVLRCYLYAAAVAGRSMADVARWVGNSRDRGALDILEHHGGTPPGWVNDVRQIVEGAPEKTRESVFLSLALTFQFMADPVIARSVVPAAGEQTLDVRRFLEEHGTLYLIATERPYGSLAPLFAALTGHLFEEAKVLASHGTNGRLDPPLMMALDEAALICPVPLERWTSDGGGRGIPLVITVQSPSQLFDRWGKEAGRTIWSNAAVKLVFGGLTVAEHLDDISSLCGDRDERVRSHSQSEGRHTLSTSLRRVPVLSSDRLRTLGPFRTLILHRTTRPVLGLIDPVWKRADVRRAA
jgi:type IV secretion system protein VirD4